jgi:hypothetical protein
MNAPARRTGRNRVCSPHWIAVGAIAVVLASIGRAEAAPIRKQHDAELAGEGIPQGWSHFLLGGPTLWATHEQHPLYDLHVRTAIWNIIKTDPGGENPMIAYLLWKQSLDPARFDHFHPSIGPAIDKLVAPKVALTSTPPASPPSQSTPGTPTTPPSEGQQITPPTTTPEPSTWIMAVGMAGWAFWRCRKRR